MRKWLSRITAPICLTAIFSAITILGAITTAYAQTDGRVVAKVNGTNITEKEVDDSVVSQLFPLEQQIYAVRKAALENLITRIVLENEARKRGITIDQLKEQLTAGKVEVSSSEVEKVYSENASVFGAMSPDEAKERLRLDLETQARMKQYRDALAELRKNSHIEWSLEEPRLPSIDAETGPSTGPKSAAVTIVEFSDFQCPYCRGSQSALKQVQQNYGNEVRLVFKHLPLDIHAEAFASAQAAFCAGEQSFFWKYQDALFASDSLSAEAFNKIASNLGLNVPKFKACLDSESSRTAILKDVRQAQQFGISSTPTFIVNGKIVRGAIAFEDFKTIIERELKSAAGGSRTQ
jgi:predicted DsbA family dithiol-disulfide isomerase